MDFITSIFLYLLKTLGNLWFSVWFSDVFRGIPANIYLLKLPIETLEKDVKHVQS